MPEIDLRVRDGQVVDVEEILSEIRELRPNLVAVSVLATSYANALRIAKEAKSYGAHTVFGNDQASQVSVRILRHRSDVDYVIGSEYGERPFELLVRALRDGHPKVCDIPDITYRERGQVKGFDYSRDRASLSILKSAHYKAPKRAGALDVFPVVDRTLYPTSHWHQYRANYMSKYAHLHSHQRVGNVTTMNRARGCSRAADPKKCKFCDMLLDISFSSPELFWQEVTQAYEDVGATLFYETCDSLSSFRKFISGVANAKPKNLPFDPQFLVYGQAVDIVKHPEVLDEMKRIGVYRINLGLESGCDATLKHMKGDHDSVATNYAALKLIKQAGIYAYGSIVLGSDAETPDTLAETVSWCKKILEEDLLVDVSCQAVAALPRNVYGRRLIANNLIHHEADDSDIPWSLDEISKIYVDTYSGVSFDDAIAASTEVRAFAANLGIASGSGAASAHRYKPLARSKNDNAISGRADPTKLLPPPAKVAQVKPLDSDRIASTL